MGRDYEYRGLVARSWDFLRGDTSGYPDLDFYRRIIKDNGEPALIVGCGTGRLPLAYRADSLDVDGVDVSSEMVAICRRKAQKASLNLNVYIQPMEGLRLPRSYRTIVVPSSSFQLVTDPASAQNTLDGFHHHLQPGGKLVIAIWHILKRDDGKWGDWWLVADREGFEGEKRLRRWERSKYDPDTQLRHTENRYELLSNDEIVYSEAHRRSPELRSYSPSQLAAMFESAGFSAVHAVSGFSIKLASDEDEVFCIFGTRA